MINFTVRNALGKGFIYDRTGTTFDYFDTGYKLTGGDPVVYRYDTNWFNDYGIATYVARSWMSKNLSHISFLNEAGKTLISISGTRNELPIDRSSGYTSYLNDVPSGEEYLFFDEDINFTGTKYDDYVNFEGAADVIANGGAGNDYFSSGGKVIMNGGVGNDTLKSYFTSGGSKINGGDGNDSFFLSIDYSKLEAISISGGNGRDTIYLDGESREKLLISGGSGRDTFIFKIESGTAYSNNIIITDFKRGADKISIELDYSDWAIDDFAGISLTHNNGDTVITVDGDYKVLVQDELIYMGAISYEFV